MARIFSVFGSVALVALLTPALGGCEGAITKPPGGGTAESPPGGLAPGAASPEAGASPPAGTTTPPLGGFVVPAEQPVLLPFETRLSKVAAVVGLPESDAVFDLLRQNATRLGGYDFANGVVPDNTWTALRLSLWLQSLQPVCASAAMAARFPSLPESLGPFIEAAYGRAMNDADLADVEAARAGLALTPEQTSRTLCLTLLSSTELVIQ